MTYVALAQVLSSTLATPVLAEGIKLGVLLGFTEPLEAMDRDMVAGAELAINEVGKSGLLLDDSAVAPAYGDSACIDAAAAVERWSDASAAVRQNVAIPNGIVTVSSLPEPRGQSFDV